MDCFCPNMTDEEFLSWDMVEHEWTGKTFYRVRVPMISHFPVAPELKIPKVIDEIKRKGLQPAVSPLILYNDGMLLGSLLIEIKAPVEKHANVHKMGPTKVISKFYKGPRHLVPKALKDFDRALMGRQIMTNDFYFWFLSCKNCNKKDKENRTIIFAKT